MCIGSCIAPILSDLFLSGLSITLSKTLQNTKVCKVFRFVDDFLFLIDCTSGDVEARVDEVLPAIKQCLAPLEVTCELPQDGSIRFLDLRLFLSENHTCWWYEPRANKPLLSFASAHSKLIKRGIANLCFKNALTKSCHHKMASSFDTQSKRLNDAGYPILLQVSVAERILKESRKENRREVSAYSGCKVGVIPYMHTVSHNLKKVAQRANVRVVFSAPKKLGELCKLTCPRNVAPPACDKKHHVRFVDCVSCVIYKFSLSCGMYYIGQTKRCLNDRLREHCYNARNKLTAGGFLAAHCKGCGCSPDLYSCIVIGRSRDRLTREIKEAEAIKELGHLCVSSSSISFSEKEMTFLGLRTRAR